MKKTIKIIRLVLLVLFLAGMGLFADYYYNVNTPIDADGKDAAFSIEKGDGVKKIAADLERAGLVKSSFYFETYVWLEKKQADFKAGEYVLSPKLSSREIVRIFTRGETLNRERTIKLIEGWNSKEMAKYLEAEGVAKADDFLRLASYSKNEAKKAGAAKDYSEKFSYLADRPADAGLEGYLFPDTYRIFKDATSSDVIEKMLYNLDRKLTREMREEIARQKKTVFEIMTMASLVEKEVGSAEDMKIVAGIFWNRIKSGQALESCASLAYILGVNKPQYTIEDTKVRSPYNTYQNRGLPPGPITNPGIKAIAAAIYPTKTDYYYFLSRPDTGETVFSKTFEEHIANKAKYLD